MSFLGTFFLWLCFHSPTPPSLFSEDGPSPVSTDSMGLLRFFWLSGGFCFVPKRRADPTPDLARPKSEQETDDPTGPLGKGQKRVGWRAGSSAWIASRAHDFLMSLWLKIRQPPNMVSFSLGCLLRPQNWYPRVGVCNTSGRPQGQDRKKRSRANT